MIRKLNYEENRKRKWKIKNIEIYNIRNWKNLRKLKSHKYQKIRKSLKWKE